MKKLIVSGLLAACYCSFALADSVAANAPAFKTFQVGKLQVTALHDKDNFLANDAKVVGVSVGEKAVADVLSNAGAPTESIKLSVDGLLIKDGQKNILLDTGLGPAVHGQLVTSLEKAGYQPEQITDVLITHVHGDHIGGLVTADGKQAFANATVQISAPDWAWLQTMPKMAALVKIIQPQVKTFQPGDQVLPGIKSVSLPGHTPGHVGYQVTSGKARLLDIGDSAHSAIVSLAKPEWAIAYDNDRAEGIANRKALLAKLAADHELIFAPHFPFPGVGYIVAKGDHYAFQAAE
ncbi:MBL fold metallo-hydrolase [Paramixta manurensis]|uniref:MBL fold metallo-hydrolase n=1 Tax=Paramixta manurensis TaxID=2740817 RepID=A0A6M8U8A0_9GAMM|nr:MBL fold metallo-hydrolase [Erwiniaceae bacterium PD-1]